MRNLLFSVVAVVLLGSFVFKQFVEPPVDENKEKVLIQTMLARLEQLHYQPVELDDHFSEDVFDLYLDRLDGGKRFFTQIEIDQLKKYRHLIDDESVEGNYEFFNLSQDLFAKAVDKTEIYFKEILEKPFDLRKDESFETDAEKKKFAANDTELKDYWRKILKARVIAKISDKLEEQEKADETKDVAAVESGDVTSKVTTAKEEKAPKKDIVQLEKEAREKTLKDFERWYKRIRKRKRADNLSMYLNVITNVFDPHTGYFKPIDKENFDINMSGSLEGIGARLSSDGEETSISSVVVGGPAWKQGDLESNDVIQLVQQEGEEPVDITGWDINDVVKIIRGKKGTVVILHAKKKDGSVQKIKIVRDLVVMEDAFAKSLIIQDKGGKKYGYIKLPKFYVDFNRKGGKSCAVDMEAEIQKLKAAGVNGIAIDLRNNGGGSLRDVVTIGGLFVPEGPIVQVKPRIRKARVLNDDDPATQYDGPLVIMVNSFSASASEILAAAMQDYDRAIIVGSEQTYGKGTVQTFLSLDRGSPRSVQPLGDIKLTTQKFYRINGGSTQLKGVASDVVIPDDFAYLDKGERDTEHPLPWTQIDKVSYRKFYTIKNKKEVVRNSQRRIANNPVFTKINENALRYQKVRDSTIIDLEFDTYRAFEKMQETKAKEFEDIMTEIPNFEVTNMTIDLPEIQKDSTNITKNKNWIENVKKDAYIFESLKILEDIEQ